MSFFDRHDQHNTGGYNFQNNIDNSVHNTSINLSNSSSQQPDDYVRGLLILPIIAGGLLIQCYDQFSMWVQKWYWLIFSIIIILSILEALYVYKNFIDSKRGLICNVIQSLFVIGSMIIWKLQNVDDKLRPLMKKIENNFIHYFIINSNEARVIILYCFLQTASLLVIALTFCIEIYYLIKNKKSWCGLINLLYLFALGIMVFNYFLLSTNG